MLGKTAVKKEKALERRIAQELIAELLLECQCLSEYSEVIGACKMARELGLITQEERKQYEEIAYRKHFAYEQERTEERKRKAEEYKAARIAKAKEEREKTPT